MQSLKINILKKTRPTRIKSKKEPPKVVSYIHNRPIDTSVSKFTLTINKLYKHLTAFKNNIKNYFSGEFRK